MKLVSLHESDIQRINLKLKITKYFDDDVLAELNIKRISTGQTNDVFLIDSVKCGRKYILIMPKETMSNSLALNFKAIYHNTKIAGDLAIGPQVLYSSNMLLEEHILGATLYDAKPVDRKAFLSCLVSNFIKLHNYSDKPVEFKTNRDPFEDMELFYSAIQDKGLISPELKYVEEKKNEILQALDLFRMNIKKVFDVQFMTPCHNDIQAGNLIFQENEDGLILKFIDWDYSGIGDRFYDLASALNRCFLTEEEINIGIEKYIDILLNHYKISGERAIKLKKHLVVYTKLMLPIANYWCALFCGFQLTMYKVGEERYQLRNKRMQHYLSIFSNMEKQLASHLYTDPIYTSDELNTYLDVAKNMLHKIGQFQLYIIGGCAKSIIDHALKQAPISIRDVDLVVVCNKTLTERDIVDFESKIVSGNQVRIKRWNKKRGMLVNGVFKPSCQIGYQIFVRDNTVSFDFDFTFINYISCFDFYGVLNTDQIMIAINPGVSFQSIVALIRKHGYQKSSQMGIIRDNKHGYISWINCDPIIHWNVAEASPVDAAFRVVRTYSKLCLRQVRPDLVLRIKNKVDQLSELKVDRFFRCFFRILGDKNAYLSFMRLESMGVLHLFDRYSNCDENGFVYLAGIICNYDLDTPVIVNQLTRLELALERYDIIIQYLNFQAKLEMISMLMEYSETIALYERDDDKIRFISAVKMKYSRFQLSF